MPTVAIQPSLQSTQAIGAVLLHQFARERFAEEGVDQNLIDQAEAELTWLRQITPSLVQNSIDPASESSNNNVRSNHEDSSKNLGNGSTMNVSEESSTIIQSTLSTENNVTNGSQTDEPSSATGNQFHSVADATIDAGEATMYHSMTAVRACANSDLDKASKLMASYGQELRNIAIEFERTRLRQDIKEKASKISLADINRETFNKLLEELFQDGVSRVKIVTLFFFCTDVALRAASFARELVVKLLGWSFSYIINRVCKIVHQLGGWERVLFHQVPSLLISSCALLGICLLTVYLIRAFRAPSLTG